EIYNGVEENVLGTVYAEWSLCRESLVGCSTDVCGKRIVGRGIRKGSEWWNEAVKKVVDEKKRAYEEWLQCNTLEKYEIYKQKRMEVKRKVKEAKKAADVRWGESFGRDWV
ncbi:hypothetical protein, partial [Klebsiella pneumoniae]|uniref:hypothetical protein n=1 Tax=Klebsiella pneumoniae TaxID=573 RepID=UPI003EB75AC9